MRRRPSPNGFPEETRIAVARRSGWSCEAKTQDCTGKAGHFHHRQPRRLKDQSPANCLHVCSPCHRHIHDNPTKSYLMGWMVRTHESPEDIPVRRGEG